MKIYLTTLLIFLSVSIEPKCVDYLERIENFYQRDETVILVEILSAYNKLKEQAYKSAWIQLASATDGLIPKNT